MWRRLCSLVMALLVTSAPLAADICRIACEKPVGTLAEHSCHDAAAAAVQIQTGAPLAKSSPHACDHDAATDVSAPSSLPAATWVRTEAAIVVAATHLQSPSRGIRHVPPLFRLPLRL